MMRARHEGQPKTCVNCAEPVVRLQADGGHEVSRWVHTPNRLNCLSPFREVTDLVATPRPVWPHVSAVAS